MRHTSTRLFAPLSRFAPLLHRCPTCGESTSHYIYAKFCPCMFCGVRINIPRAPKHVLKLSEKAMLRSQPKPTPAHYTGCKCETCAALAHHEEKAKRGLVPCKRSDKHNRRRLRKMHIDPFRIGHYEICCSIARRQHERQRHPPTSCPYRRKKIKGEDRTPRPLKMPAVHDAERTALDLPKKPKRVRTAAQLQAKHMALVKAREKKTMVLKFYDGFKLNAEHSTMKPVNAYVGGAWVGKNEAAGHL